MGKPGARGDLAVPCVAVVITDASGRVLLGRRASGVRIGLWAFPGGAIEPGEDVAAAAVREAHEETGLVIEPERLLSVVTNHFEAFSALVVVVAASVVSGDEQPGDELNELRWLSLIEPLAEPIPEMAFEGDARVLAKLAAEPGFGLPLA
jgi:acetyl-CoA carboxylase carboxyl transferase subunit beta